MALEINKIHCGDCLELIPQIEDKSIDVILCVLPYGVTAMKWDNIIPMEKLWKEYERIIKPNGAIILFSQQPFTSMLIASNITRFRHCYCWIKNLKTNFLQANKMPMRGHENIVVFGLNTPNYYPIMKKTQWYTTGNELETEQYKTKRRKQVKRNGECLPDDVLNFKGIHGSQKRYHKNEKPIELIEHLIKTYTKEGETVLDNCVGGGTTAVGCKNTNRNFIAIEKEQEYVDIANERLNGTEFKTNSFEKTEERGLFLF